MIVYSKTTKPISKIAFLLFILIDSCCLFFLPIAWIKSDAIFFVCDLVGYDMAAISLCASERNVSCALFNRCFVAVYYLFNGYDY